ncbi:sensor histidine kinase [Flavobacterium aquiphilum]|uniref:sensor histidine kinase n=1 Tax=Flavobacterium aquiphilum TaxID=3003261 RepID=UPI002480D9D7|nr:HAMP domain-containing sensor histidine kinase [Flavobacterium aquiphilum]
MTQIKDSAKSKNHNIILLYIILFFSCTSLIVINYITIRILSASRAYINGESHYSKGQNKASRYLITYLYTENNKNWESFNKELSVPLGDQLARVALTQNLNDSIAKRGFRTGRNKEDDLDDLIWVFKNFNTVPFLKKAIDEWKNADESVNQLHKIGIKVHQKLQVEKLDEETKRKLSSEISLICERLGAAADRFSNIVGDGTRKIKDNLITINIFFILLIISSTSIYYVITLKKMILSEKALKSKKAQLREMVNDLEKTKIELSTEIVQHKKLIGTISHDIKSPLKYLAMTNKYIYEEAKNYDNEKLKKNTKSVYSSTLQLFNFIDSLLTYSKIFFGGKSSENSVYNLKELVQMKHNLFHEIAEASNNILINEIDEKITTKINKDILSVVLHNIIDNAIKNTEDGVIKTYSYIKNKKLYLIVEDTGKGFKEEDLVYYNQLSNQQSAEKLMLKNSGMGILMIVELIHILNGDINFFNKKEQGAKVEIITDLN